MEVVKDKTKSKATYLLVSSSLLLPPHLLTDLHPRHIGQLDVKTNKKYHHMMLATTYTRHSQFTVTVNLTVSILEVIFISVHS